MLRASLLFISCTGQDKGADSALEWRNGPYPNREFQLKWERVIRDWSQCWGKKVEGWWFDGCYFPNSMYRSTQPPNFESFAAAARAGNPDAVIAFNPGVVYRILSMTPHEDFTAGEIDKPDSKISPPFLAQLTALTEAERTK
jgi:hypothetical protein